MMNKKVGTGNYQSFLIVFSLASFYCTSQKGYQIRLVIEEKITAGIFSVGLELKPHERNCPH